MAKGQLRPIIWKWIFLKSKKLRHTPMEAVLSGTQSILTKSIDFRVLSWLFQTQLANTNKVSNKEIACTIEWLIHVLSLLARGVAYWKKKRGKLDHRIGINDLSPFIKGIKFQGRDLPFQIRERLLCRRRQRHLLTPVESLIVSLGRGSILKKENSNYSIW